MVFNGFFNGFLNGRLFESLVVTSRTKRRHKFDSDFTCTAQIRLHLGFCTSRICLGCAVATHAVTTWVRQRLLAGASHALRAQSLISSQSVPSVDIEFCDVSAKIGKKFWVVAIVCPLRMPLRCLSATNN